MRRLILLLTLALPLAASCERALVVQVDPTGTEKLPLSGELNRTGVLLRELKVGPRTVPEGARVHVYETWLLRREKGASPPGYRVTGLYDPAQRSEGFALPAGTIDVYFMSSLEDDRAAQIPVPKEAVRLDPP